MGMFDEIIVPKSYLRGILDKKDEELFDTYHKFQTKDLENSLAVYKVYRKQLYRAADDAVWVGEALQSHWDGGGKRKPKSVKWDKMTAPVVDKISFGDHLTDKDGNEYWFRFEFGFVDNKLDSKKLVDRTVSSKESQEAIQVMWDIEQEVFDEHRQKLSYRFWSKVERVCQKLTNIARNKHSIPYDIRKQAYKTSGRLAHDPDCLKWYLKTDCDRDI